ncbi:hypothetical protein LMG7141_00831 [Ralstonia condita]|uniref:Uncharacterized protein n=1 Tax=Ralstonia condita TaxID=3058600 RepID=A0ABN9IDD6_9RALS|nr:hypothetical protein [Ralstonia sp. LMG 7141]CAJ0779033.1 hypothetical protein LMG7141_00831 [Ralstonia sp. LMG 7141]
MNANQAYDEICRLAREHALVYQAAGGVVMIVHQDTQKEQGIYEHIQYVHGLGPHPENKEIAAYESLT